jgi:hypothetical protein
MRVQARPGAAPEYQSTPGTARNRRSGPADRCHTGRDQALHPRAAELRHAFPEDSQTTRQKIPFCRWWTVSPPTKIAVHIGSRSYARARLVTLGERLLGGFPVQCKIQ